MPVLIMVIKIACGKDDLSESDFYDKLDELKKFVGIKTNFKLINIDDENELEFLEED